MRLPRTGDFGWLGLAAHPYHAGVGSRGADHVGLDAAAGRPARRRPRRHGRHRGRGRHRRRRLARRPKPHLGAPVDLLGPRLSGRPDRETTGAQFSDRRDGSGHREEPPHELTLVSAAPQRAGCQTRSPVPGLAAASALIRYDLTMQRDFVARRCTGIGRRDVVDGLIPLQQVDAWPGSPEPAEPDWRDSTEPPPAAIRPTWRPSHGGGTSRRLDSFGCELSCSGLRIRRSAVRGRRRHAGQLQIRGRRSAAVWWPRRCHGQDAPQYCAGRTVPQAAG